MKSATCNHTTLLHCCEIDKTTRYTLESQELGEWNNFHVYWRKANSQIQHHKKNKTILTESPEFILVPQDGHSVYSISVNNKFEVQDVYCNINHQPYFQDGSWYWQDLELDVKVVYDLTDGPVAYLLDWDEFKASNLSQEDRELALKIAQKRIHEVKEKKALFSYQLGKELSKTFKDRPELK